MIAAKLTTTLFNCIFSPDARGMATQKDFFRWALLDFISSCYKLLLTEHETKIHTSNKAVASWLLRNGPLNVPRDGEVAMNIYDYCESVVTELGNWRQKLAVLDAKIGALPTGSKEKMFGNIEELHMVIAEIEDRIYSLEHACPVVWRPEATAEGVGPVTINYDAALSAKADYDFGG